MATLALSLGLCRRAGKLVIGTPLVLEAVRKGKASLVLLAADVSENTEKKITPLCAHRGVPAKKCALTKTEIAKAIGKENEVGAVAVGQEFLNLISASL